MNTHDIFMNKIYIQNNLSLYNVELPLKPLTIIVENNLEESSKILKNLGLLRKVIRHEKLSSIDFISENNWTNHANHINFQLNTSIDNKDVYYMLNLRLNENLDVDYTQAISSVNKYENKSSVDILNKYISSWQFYDFNPCKIRETKFYEGDIQQLNYDGSNIRRMLEFWVDNRTDLFQKINKKLENYVELKLNIINKINMDKIHLFEIEYLKGFSKLVPIEAISDETLQQLAYLVLVNQPQLPELIIIKEPEKNLHPTWLNTLGNILIELSEKTQVIITTHSEQLLNMFNSEKLQDNLNILTLQNISSEAAKVIPLDNIR